MPVVSLDMSKECAVIARPKRPEIGRKTLHKRLCVLQGLASPLVGKDCKSRFLKQRRFGREMTRPHVCGGEFTCLFLARLDVRLIEGIDGENCTGNRGCKLPAEELLADLIAVSDRNAHDRIARSLERRHRVILCSICLVRQPQIGEYTIFVVNLRGPKRFCVDRDEALAL